MRTENASEPLFSKKNKKLITDPLTDNNPVTIQVLGICSALAITVQVSQAVVMSLSVLFVTCFCTGLNVNLNFDTSGN